MISREEALKFLDEKVANKNIVKHMLATEALMDGVYEALAAAGKTDLGGSKEKWMMAGLLHDGDYSETVPVEKQGIQVAEWLRAARHEIPEDVAQTMAAHNWQNTGVEPETLMDWALFCGDSLTGLIVAATLVLPSKKLADVDADMVLRRFKEKAFARGTRREDIALCEEKLGISLKEFVEICLEAMQNINGDLNL
ncbi:MAG TPA: hypothetical protein VMX76_02280 [Nevskiaceae bacterium]|nr:hypothetical protein [Nevskiaceae bacterium]